MSARAPHRRSVRAAVPWAQGLLCGVLVAVATPTAALLSALLAPSMAAAVLDLVPGKPVARCMALSGLAAAMLPIADLWGGGHSMEVCLSLLANPPTLGVAWVAQGGGWLLCELLPLLLGSAQTLHAAAATARLRAERSKLEQDWGLPPAEPDAPMEPADLPPVPSR